MGMGMVLSKEGAKNHITPPTPGGFLSLKGPGQGPQLRESRSFADSSSSLPAKGGSKGDWHQASLHGTELSTIQLKGWLVNVTAGNSLHAADCRPLEG